MVELHPRQVGAIAARNALIERGQSTFGMALTPRRGRPVWNQTAGALLLVRWTGERFPIPGLGFGAERRGTIVGCAPGNAIGLSEWPGVGHAPSTLYHYAVVPVSGGGIVGPINPMTIITRVFDADGGVLGALPNAPGGISVRAIAGGKMLITWMYARAGQLGAPTAFRVFRALNGAAMGFASALAEVTYRAGRTQYSYTDGPLAPGDVAYYTVRAVNTAGLSLIARLRGGPSPSYDAVALEQLPCATVPSGPPPAIGNLAGETQ